MIGLPTFVDKAILGVHGRPDGYKSDCCKASSLIQESRGNRSQWTGARLTLSTGEVDVNNAILGSITFGRLTGSIDSFSPCAKMLR